MLETTTQTLDYTEVMVTKPWGYEYLMYQSEHLAIWSLHIDCGKQTSLHCHPKKKTGLILLSGEAEIMFLNNSMKLKALNKLMIRPGLFHSTKALSPDGICLIEVETPPDKVNLVRLDDTYGRKEQPYEGAESLIPLMDHCIQLEIPVSDFANQYSIYDCLLTIEKSDSLESLNRYDPEDIIVVIEGGIFSHEGEPLLSRGDVVSRSTVDRLAGTFKAPYGVTYIAVQKS